MLKASVAFIIFNRPDLTQIVFNEIKKAEPKQLFIIADGPRTQEEWKKCKAARDIIKQVDWSCEVFCNYSDVNLGCRDRVSSGITWVFEHVEEAIILEDDCVPCKSFFTFCHDLLEYYRHDTRVMMISGNNFQNSISRTSHSYYFSKFTHIWGWATWKRAWQHWHYDKKLWLEFRDQGLLKNIIDTTYEADYWLETYNDFFLNKQPNTWDYAWGFACKSQGGLAVLPSRNLVSNIGFRADATHTKQSSSLANLKTEDIFEINHPPFVHRHKEADFYTFDYHYGGLAFKRSQTIPYRIASNLKKIVKRLLIKASKYNDFG